MSLEAIQPSGLERVKSDLASAVKQYFAARDVSTRDQRRSFQEKPTSRKEMDLLEAMLEPSRTFERLIQIVQYARRNNVRGFNLKLLIKEAAESALQGMPSTLEPTDINRRAQDFYVEVLEAVEKMQGNGMPSVHSNAEDNLKREIHRVGNALSNQETFGGLLRMLAKGSSSIGAEAGDRKSN